ncbi:B-cell receptor-associated protein 31-like-domain-containing protein [Radiomyces spectabilis]|uniref:B-cell receptor-associated protein 31-like-domain-containing protein n=1 Tax=Radiomyces spectabilis TaxID=64574 RepID=UPI0022209639|nr:B-cell receptor-associated protein 31-like-domain-containing protein [Radiomyces spectabilis]KAI8370322.1 B-cell receptor-associated protein 31-like-domain-containing protein [Radiomyces spectabilis]
MTIYYTLTFFILLLEMFSFCLLVLPLPFRWRSALMRFVTTSPVMAKAFYGLKIVFGFIFVLFADTINRLQRIEAEKEEDPANFHDYGYEASFKAKKFYAQRNLYLTGFTLFLSLILERTCTLVTQMLKREEELDAIKKEAALTSEDQNRIIQSEKSYKDQLAKLTEEAKELRQKERDFASLKKRAAQQSEEYERLIKEEEKFNLCK